MNRHWIYRFWAGMDFIYLVRFAYLNVSQGKIPIVSDVQSFVALALDHGVVSLLLFSLSLLLNLSILVSMVLFLRDSPAARYLAFAQLPLRLVFGLPSISLLMWFAHVGGATSSLLLLGLLLVSETLKVTSILLVERRR